VYSCVRQGEVEERQSGGGKLEMHGGGRCGVCGWQRRLGKSWDAH
jgi:hypothetical protein